MKHILTVLTLSAVLASPAWSFPPGVLLKDGVIIDTHYAGTSMTKSVTYLVLFDYKVFRCTHVYFRPDIECMEIEGRTIMK